MNRYVADVKQCYDKFGMVIPASFQLLEPDLLKFRTNFFHEELQEYVDAQRDGDLPTAIDSLIDLVYICAGSALLYGIGPDSFDVEVNKLLPAEVTRFSMYGQDEVGYPHLLKQEHSDQLVKLITDSINNFIAANEAQSEADIKTSLVMIYLNCLAGASWMGFTQDTFDVLWADVQRANLEKERATSNDQSKRGSAKYDIVKGPNWVGPKGKELIAKMLERIHA